MRKRDDVKRDLQRCESTALLVLLLVVANAVLLAACFYSARLLSMGIDTWITAGGME